MPGFSDGFGIGHGLSSLVWIIAIIVIGVIVWRGRADAISDRGIKFRVPGVTHDNAHCSEIWDFLVDRISDQAKIVSWKIQVNGCGGGTFQAEDPKIEAYTLARFGLPRPCRSPGLRQLLPRQPPPLAPPLWLHGIQYRTIT